MLEPYVYLCNERIAQLQGNYHHSFLSAMKPELFIQNNMNLRVESLRETLPLLESMNDGMFERCQQIYGEGFSQDELNILVDAAIKVIDIQSPLGQRTAVVPLDSLVANLAYSDYILDAIKSIHTSANRKPSMLEIGAGNGLGPPFYCNALDKYYSIEVTQPFYLLQNLVYSEIFASITEYADYQGENAVSPTFSLNKKLDNFHVIDFKSPKSLPAAFHIPWWRISDLDLIIPSKSIELVVANACLNEIDRGALEHYFDLFDRILTGPCYVFYACTGALRDNRNLDSIFSERGFSLIYKLVGTISVSPSSLITMPKNMFCLWTKEPSLISSQQSSIISLLVAKTKEARRHYDRSFLIDRICERMGFNS